MVSHVGIRFIGDTQILEVTTEAEAQKVIRRLCEHWQEQCSDEDFEIVWIEFWFSHKTNEYLSARQVRLYLDFFSGNDAWLEEFKEGLSKAEEGVEYLSPSETRREPWRD